MAKQLQISDFIRESKGSKLHTLNSGDVISVFHGTDFNNAYEFALNGFDATAFLVPGMLKFLIYNNPSEGYAFPLILSKSTRA